MKAKMINSIKFKDGSVWEKGTEVIIEMQDRERPDMAFLTKVGSDEPPKKVKSLRLHYWFSEFIEPTPDIYETAVMDGVCPSLTGQEVEPDGWDKHGFPSILLAALMI